jgi:hypothetical protein
VVREPVSTWLDVPRWLKAWSGHQPGDFVCRSADDPTRPDPVAAERERLERQRVRESRAGEAAERDLLDQRSQRERDLVHEQGPSWVTPGEVLARFPRLAQRLAEGMPEPTAMAYGPHNSAAVEVQWRESMRRLRDAQLDQAGIVLPALAWTHERSEVPR